MYRDTTKNERIMVYEVFESKERHDAMQLTRKFKM